MIVSPAELLAGQWRLLTDDRSSLQRYLTDPDFRVGLDSVAKTLGHDPAPALRRHAFLLLQPDCMARQMANCCLELVEAEGFAPVHSLRLRLRVDMVQRLWNASSSGWTPDSNVIAELICTGGESVLVVLADTTAELREPASVRLSRFKGPAQPEFRSRHSLRSLLGAAGPLVVLIHTSDEPLDLIRESAIFAGGPAQELFAAMLPGTEAATCRERVLAEVAHLQRDTEAHDLDPDAALTRLVLSAASCTTTARVREAALRVQSALLNAHEGNEPLRWSEFAEDLGLIGVDPTTWDPVVVGSKFLQISACGANEDPRVPTAQIE